MKALKALQNNNNKQDSGTVKAEEASMNGGDMDIEDNDD